MTYGVWGGGSSPELPSQVTSRSVQTILLSLTKSVESLQKVVSVRGTPENKLGLAVVRDCAKTIRSVVAQESLGNTAASVTEEKEAERTNTFTRR